MSLGENTISEISIDAFKGLEKLFFLAISSNNIRKLEKGTFNGLQNLSKLGMSYNKISEISSDALEGLMKLDYLDIGSNNISKLENGTFNGLPNLTHLYAKSNKISEFSSDLFKGLSELRVISLRKNKILKIPSDSFNGLDKLEELYLDENQISEIASDTFTGLNNLKTLAISRNRISVITRDTVAGLENLDLLFMGDNQFCTTVDDVLATTIKKTQIVKAIDDLNAWSCVDGGWGDWYSIACSVTCGNGIIVDIRECNNPHPANGGLECMIFGDPSNRGKFQTSERECVKGRCPSVVGNWGPWDFTPCSVTCGDGIRHGIRECNDPVPENGGLDCLLSGETDKRGKSEEKEGKCTGGVKCPVDGNWGAWSLSKCSNDCGNGTRLKERKCNDPEPAHGGLDCMLFVNNNTRGKTEKQNEQCSDHTCPAGSNNNKVAIILGPIVGVIVLILIGAFVFWYCRMINNQQAPKLSPSNNIEIPSTNREGNVPVA